MLHSTGSAASENLIWPKSPPRALSGSNNTSPTEFKRSRNSAFITVLALARLRSSEISIFINVLMAAAPRPRETPSPAYLTPGQQGTSFRTCESSVRPNSVSSTKIAKNVKRQRACQNRMGIPGLIGLQAHRVVGPMGGTKAL